MKLAQSLIAFCGMICQLAYIKQYRLRNINMREGHKTFSSSPEQVKKDIQSPDIPWWQIARISGLAFLANQLLELAILTSFGKSYADLCIWDCGWYTTIVNHGYDLVPAGHDKGDAANWAFFPALPMISRAIGFFTGINTPYSLIITSKIFFLLSIFAFTVFCIKYNNRISIYFCAFISAFQPYAIYGNVGYTESMFLFGSCLSLIFMQQKRYISAGLSGGLLSAVRSVGIALCLAYAVLFLRDAVTRKRDRERIIVGALLLPLGLSLYMLFLHFWVGDALAFSHIQRAWNREIQNPISVLRANWDTDSINLAYYGSALLALVSIGYHTARKRFDLAVFSLFCTLVPLSTGILSMTRYVWWQAPILLACTECISALFRLRVYSVWKVWALRALIFSVCSALIFLQIFMYQSWIENRFYMI